MSYLISDQASGQPSSSVSLISGPPGQTLDLRAIPNCGLIFVRSNDVLSMIAVSITKQPYSTIGFFHKTDISGKEKVNVILVDVYRFTTPSWLSHGATIDDLIDNPLVTSISLKGLSPVLNEDGGVNEKATSDLCTRFRMAIGKVIGQGAETSLEETISQLFGYEVKHPTKGVTAVEMVNRVIKMIGMWDKVPPDGTLSNEALRLLEAPTLLDCDSQAKIQMIQILTGHFNQQEVCNPGVANKLMQSYIVTNDLFSEIITVSLPDRDPHRIRQAQEATASLHADYMSALVAKFVQMLIHDQGFCQTVIAGFNQTRMAEMDSSKNLRRSLLALAEESQRLIQVIISWLISGEITYENLMGHLASLNTRQDEIAAHHRLSVTSPEPLPVIDRSKLLLVKKGHVSDHGPDYLIGAYMCLRDQLSTLADQSRRGETLMIDLNALLDPLNDMGQVLGLKIPPLHPVPGNHTMPAAVRVTSDRQQAVPLILKNGRQIYLPLVHPDLSDLDLDTLQEILDALDTVAGQDCRFNQLRREIVERIAHLEH